MSLKEDVLKLKKEKNAIILAHYYVDGAVQDVADFVGDSYALAKKAKNTDADIIEELNRDIAAIRKQAFNDDVENEDLLEQMSTFENLNMKIRENLTDKQRILNSLLKSQKITEDKSELPIMLKDIRSLIDHTNFNFERIDYLQNIFIGLLSVEQNKVIKIFTIVNVIFLPPTLIASIYGMNCDIMPELNWEYGYLFSIGVMILAAVTPLIIFKKKGWI